MLLLVATPLASINETASELILDYSSDKLIVTHPELPMELTACKLSDDSYRLVLKERPDSSEPSDIHTIEATTNDPDELASIIFEHYLNYIPF